MKKGSLVAVPSAHNCTPQFGLSNVFYLLYRGVKTPQLHSKWFTKGVPRLNRPGDRTHLTYVCISGSLSLPFPATIEFLNTAKDRLWFLHTLHLPLCRCTEAHSDQLHFWLAAVNVSWAFVDSKTEIPHSCGKKKKKRRKFFLFFIFSVYMPSFQPFHTDSI